MSRHAACVAALIVSLAALSAAAGPAFVLGILRRDGVLIPLAAFNGREWSAPWPESDTGVSLPIGLDDVPKKWWGPIQPGSRWTAWMLDDGVTRPLKIEEPAQVRVFCEGHLGLRTDYKGAAVDSREQGMPKDALAVASDQGTVPVQPIIDVSVHSPDAARLVKSMTDAFNAEEKRAADEFSNWGHPYSTPERIAIPIELEAFYRVREQTATHGEWLLNYVEAVRRFPARPEDKGCGLITFAQGWIVERSGRPPEFHLTARVTYCDREGVSFMLPLGHLSVNGEHYWVYQMSSWRDEEYSVARVRPDEIIPVVEVYGGSCPK